MIPIVPGDQPSDYASTTTSTIPSHLKNVPHGKRPFFALQHQKIAGEDADIKQDNHRRREQRQVENVAGRRNNRRQDDNRQDGVPAVPDQKRRAGHMDQRQQEQQDRNLENDAHAEHHIDEQVVILRHVDGGVDAFADPEAQQEFETVAERDEIGEQAAEDEQAGARNDERSRPPALAFVKPGRDERPDLIKNPRRGKKDRRTESAASST